MQNQTCNDFEWFIVDDGSTDDTGKYVSEWMKSYNKFNIRYVAKENGGKHTALNFGIKMIESELTFIVDSDDVLTNDAVEIILRYHRRYGEMQNICGYAFLREIGRAHV